MKDKKAIVIGTGISCKSLEKIISYWLKLQP